MKLRPQTSCVLPKYPPTNCPRNIKCAFGYCFCGRAGHFQKLGFELPQNSAKRSPWGFRIGGSSFTVLDRLLRDDPTNAGFMEDCSTGSTQASLLGHFPQTYLWRSSGIDGGYSHSYSGGAGRLFIGPSGQIPSERGLPEFSGFHNATPLPPLVLDDG